MVYTTLFIFAMFTFATFVGSSYEGSPSSSHILDWELNFIKDPFFLMFITLAFRTPSGIFDKRSYMESPFLRMACKIGPVEVIFTVDMQTPRYVDPKGISNFLAGHGWHLHEAWNVLFYLYVDAIRSICHEKVIYDLCEYI